MALFDTIVASRTHTKNLVEFRAGKMVMKGKMVHPDKRKGLVYIHQSDDSLMHFCWKDRTSGAVEDVKKLFDLIIFPDDIEFKHVSQCTTGRVYVLKFKSSSRKFFFWLQEPKTDKDDEYCKKVNEFLKNPPVPGSSRGSSGLPSDLSGLGEQDLHSILGGMNQQQLMQLLGGIGMGSSGASSSMLGSLMGQPSSTQSSTSEPPLLSQPPAAKPAPIGTSSLPRSEAPRTLPQPQGLGSSGGAAGSQSSAASTTSKGQGAKIHLSDLQNILSNMNVPTRHAGQEGVDLAKALNPEAMIPILVNPEVQRKLIPFLPDGESLPKTEEELQNTIHSPQFQQALTSFSSALRSRELGPLILQFNLGQDVANAAAQGDMEAFVKAMQEAMKKDKDKDDPMKQ